MAAQQRQTAATESADQVGTMYRAYSRQSQAELRVECDLPLNRLRVHIQSGEFAYVSDWLECALPLALPLTETLLREAVALWPPLAFSRSSGQMRALTPLELTSLAFWTVEHLLA